MRAERSRRIRRGARAFSTAARHLGAAARRRWDGVGAALFGLAYFVSLTDARVLDPRRIAVVAAGDAAYHALARDFAQWDGWHWPLTRIDNYLWPVGTTAVFTDANPWVVLATKLLLPANTPPLQFVGPWLALCFVLQGWFGSRIAALATRDRLACALAGALFVTAPVLAHRLGHDTLCAHWILLALLEPALRPTTARRSARALGQTGLVLTFAAGLHPTLLAMSLPLACVSAWRHARLLRQRRVAALAAIVAGPAVVWLAFGTVGSRVERSTFGFGHFSANLLSLVDPYEASRSSLLPPLPHGDGQYEGFGYLGLGAMALAILALVVAALRLRTAAVPAGRERRAGAGAWSAVALAATLCAIFAFSSRIMAGRFMLADLSALYRPFHAITDAFRSSGRFIWPLHYFVVSVGVVGVLRLRGLRARAAIAGALLLQLVDSRRVDGRGAFTLSATPEAPSAVWRLARGQYSHLVMDPPQIETNVALCPEDHHRPGAFVPFAQIARAAHLSFNSGQAARVDERAITAYCLDAVRARAEGRYDPLAVYVRAVGEPGHEDDTSSLTCRLLDGARICVRADRSTAFARVLASSRGPRVALTGDPLVAFESGFGPANGDGEASFRWATARATLTLRRPHEGAGPAVLGFVVRGASHDGEGEGALHLRVRVDGVEAEGVAVANGIAVGSLVLQSPGEVVRLVFDVDLGPRSAPSQEGHVWQLLRLEWFAAD